MSRHLCLAATRAARVGLAVLALWGLAWPAGLQAAAPGDENIVDVLRRSQALRLAAMPLANQDSARAATVRASFAQLTDLVRPQVPVHLRVIRGPVLAETLQGLVVVANERLADLPEPVRLFVLAHELGHVQEQHWMATARLYQKWIPGEVTPAHTEPVAQALGREASALAHQHEYAADAYAAQALRALGLPDETLLAVFSQLDATRDTATHPGTRRRLASLQAQLMAP